MSNNSQYPESAYNQSGRAQTRFHECKGECLPEAKRTYDKAVEEAKTLESRSHNDIMRRFEQLYDVASSDRHKEAEVMLENAIALYEALYGQEHASIAELMLQLSALYSLHGNSDSASYMNAWAQEILNAPKDEPTHEFFHLFGMDKVDDGDDEYRPS